MVGNLSKRQFPGKEEQDFIVHIVGPVYISWNSFYVHIFEKNCICKTKKRFHVNSNPRSTSSDSNRVLIYIHCIYLTFFNIGFTIKFVSPCSYPCPKATPRLHQEASKSNGLFALTDQVSNSIKYLA